MLLADVIQSSRRTCNFDRHRELLVWSSPAQPHALHNDQKAPTMASRTRLVASTGSSLLRASRAQQLPARILPALASTHARSFSQLNSHSASQQNTPNIFSSLGQLGGQQGPPSYFQSQKRTPANTVIRFVPQQTAWIVERMGRFNRILEPGLAILIPFIDRIAYVKSLKESAIEIPSQSAITADNVTLELDGVLYTRVFDAYKARYVT